MWGITGASSISVSSRGNWLAKLAEMSPAVAPERERESERERERERDSEDLLSTSA